MDVVVDVLTRPSNQYDDDATLSPQSREEAQAQYRAECEGAFFPAIYPPTPAEMSCKRLQYQAQCEGVSFIETFPPSEAETSCLTLEYQTQCEGKQFAAISPPSEEQRRCESLKDSMSSGSSVPEH